MSPDDRKRFPIALLTSILGLLMLALWFASEATTVVPGSPAVCERWTVSVASLFLSGLLFGIAIAALVLRREQRVES